MIRELQTSEKSLNDELIHVENEADRLKQENADFDHRGKEMRILVDKNEKNLKRVLDQNNSYQDELDELTKKIVD